MLLDVGVMVLEAWARKAWPVWFTVNVVVLWRGLSEQLAVLAAPCSGCPSVFRVSAGEQQALREVGVALTGYRWFVGIVVVGFAMGCWALAWGLMYRAHRGLWPVVAGYLLVSLGAVRWVEDAAIRSVGGAVGAAALVVGVANYVAPVALFALFPDGRWTPRWSRWLVGLVLVWAGLLAVSPLGEDLAEGRDPVTPIDGGIFVACLVAILGWQVARFVGGDTVVRSQCRWVASSLVLALAMFAPVVVVGNFDVDVKPVARLVALAVVIVALFLVVLALAAAIVRHGLWNLDVVVNRALVYGGLTASVLAGYASAVLLTSGTMMRRGPWTVAVVVFVVACALEPLRRRLQARVDRMVYGTRDIRLAPTPGPLAADPQDALDRMAASIRDHTRLRGVTIEVRLSDGVAVVGRSGDLSDGDALEVPLVVDDEVVGSLRASTRRGQRRFTRADEATLARLVAPLTATAAIARLVHSSNHIATEPAVVSIPREPDVPDWLRLTSRERHLLDRLASGHTNEQIAEHLQVSQKTVRNQLSLLYAKLGVVDRSQAALAARDLGFG